MIFYNEERLDFDNYLALDIIIFIKRFVDI